MRRILSILTIAALAAAFAAAAANLGVDGGVIQAGLDEDLTCDSDGVAVFGWGVENDGADGPDGRVYNVRIGDISAQCEGADINVSITSEGSKIADGGPIVLGADNVGEDDPDQDVTVPFDAPQDPSDITDIHVIIDGGNQ